MNKYMNTQRLERWILQYNLLKKLLESFWTIDIGLQEKNTDDQKFRNETIKNLEDRKQELLEIIIKEAKEGAFD